MTEEKRTRSQELFAEIKDFGFKHLEDLSEDGYSICVLYSSGMQIIGMVDAASVTGWDLGEQAGMRVYRPINVGRAQRRDPVTGQVGVELVLVPMDMLTHEEDYIVVRPDILVEVTVQSEETCTSYYEMYLEGLKLLEETRQAMQRANAAANSGLILPDKGIITPRPAGRGR